MKKIYIHLLVSLACVTMLSFGIIIVTSTPTSALTYQTTTDVEFTVNPSINVSLSSNDLLISDLTPGTSSDSNIITVNVSTNAGYGYYLAATAGTSSGSTNLVNTADSSRVFTNLSSNKASLSNFSDNTWGYSYSTDNGTNWISGNNDAATAGYNGLPLDNNDNGATGIKLASTDSYVSTNSIKFKIGAKASTTQSGGTYTNTVNFYAVANPEPQLGPVACEAGKICYNTNVLSPTEVVGTMGRQSAGNDGDTVTLLASNYSRQGYGFAGWSDTYDYTGSLYGPQEDITVPTGTAASGLSLYAIWIPSAGSMQSNASSICSSLTAATSVTKTLTSVSALTDQRDNQTYAIAKLADGKCWMIENLRLEAENTRSAANQALAQGYGASATYGNFSGLANAESTDFSNSTTANSLYYSGTQEGTASMDIGTTNYPGYRMPRYNNWNNQSTSANRPQNPTTNDATNSTTNAGMYSYGNYYTWHAAIADLTYNGTDNSSVTNTSLCPSGWHLPTGGLAYASGNTGGVNVTGDTSTFREFYNLGYKTMDEVKTAYEDAPSGGNAYYSSNTTNTAGNTATKAFRSFPNNFLYSGSFGMSSASNRGSNGGYWSSTASSSNNSYRLSLDSFSVRPGTGYGNKYVGFSIRCTVSAGT